VYRRVQDGGGDRDWGLWAILRKKTQYSLGKHATVFQAELYALLVSVYEIET